MVEKEIIRLIRLRRDNHRTARKNVPRKTDMWHEVVRRGCIDWLFLVLYIVAVVAALMSLAGCSLIGFRYEYRCERRVEDHGYESCVRNEPNCHCGWRMARPTFAH